MRRTIKAERLVKANRDFREATERLAFFLVTIRVADDGRYWRFIKRGKHIASYWPVPAKLQLNGKDMQDCASVSKASHLVALHSQILMPDVPRDMM